VTGGLQPTADFDGHAWLAVADVLLGRAARRAELSHRRHPRGSIPAARSPESGLPLDEDVLRRVFAEGAFGEVVFGARLSNLDAQLLAMLVAIEMDVERGRVAASISGEPGRLGLTLGGLAHFAEDGGWDWQISAGPFSALQRARFVDVEEGGMWHLGRVRAGPAVSWWLLDRQCPLTDLPVGARILPAEGEGDARLVLAAGTDRVRRIQASIRSLRAPGFIVTAPPDRDAGWSALIRRASLQGLGVILELDGTLSAAAADQIDRADHLVWALCSREDLPLHQLPRRPWRYAAVDKARALSHETRGILGEAATAVGVTAEQLDLLGPAFRATGKDLPAALRKLAAGDVTQFTERIVARHLWRDLVLAEDQIDLLHEIVLRVRHNETVLQRWGFEGKDGVMAMFSGPSGTGKTLGAEVIAKDLGIDLYRVNLSRIVDKYVGETEKKLEAMFAVAEATPMVLFFDEADAIIGKRTEVSDSHDRYANVAVAYLLQRLESYTGVVILATNMPSNIDAAFTRRIDVSVQFTVPDEAQRLRLWKLVIPETAPAADLDLDQMSRHLELTGGQIRNIAVRAAFLAAADGGSMTMPTMLEATARELQKAGRMFRPQDFERGNRPAVIPDQNGARR